MSSTIEPKGLSIRALSNIIDDLAATLEERFDRRSLSRRLAEAVVLKALRRDDTQAAIDEEIQEFWRTAESWGWRDRKCAELGAVVRAVRASDSAKATADR